MRRNIILFCILSFFLIFSGCSKKTDDLQGIVTFVSGTIKINNQNAAVGFRVKKNDIVTTTDNSLAVVQLEQTAVITVHSNTELKFDELSIKPDKSQTVSLNLNKGSSFHKVMKKGTEYSVRMPTSVASVRGTSFEASVEGTKSKIKLLNGIVHVAKALNNAAVEKASDENQKAVQDNIELTAGQSIEITPEKFEKPAVLDKTEIEKLTQLDAITAVEDVEKKIPFNDNIKNTEIQTDIQKDQSSGMPELAVIPAEMKDEILKNEVFNKSNNNVLVDLKPIDKKQIYIEKLNDIKVKNDGKLDKITLRNGDVIMGMIKNRGSKYKVLTPDGTIEIQAGDIESQTITH